MTSRNFNRSAQVLGTLAALLAAALAGCSGSGDSEDTVAVNGDVAIAYAKRVNTLGMNPTDGAPFAAGGDLIIREKSSPSAPEHNVTSAYTRGVGDVSDPEVSYDGKKIVFAMNCPTGNNTAIGQNVCTGRWNIWEYTLPASGFTGGTFRRITSSTADDDVDPYYLPGGGFVFASNRQTKTKTTQAVGTQPYFALDEYERERVLNLHTMDNDGGTITQISSNQSHDRNPVVRENGNIMFSRWEHVGQRNRFAVFQVKPDGTDMFTFYGPQSPGNSFLHPREMDSRGPYAGKLVSSLMSLSGTQEGGALMIIDAANFSENNAPARPGVTGNGQRQMTQQAINDGRGFSLFGRATSPYPLWDGTNRVLTSYRPCEVTRTEPGKPTVVLSCANLTPAEIAALGDQDRMRGAPAVVNGVQLEDNVPASYALYMFDPALQTFQIVAAPPAGFMYVDGIALQARPEPQVATPTLVDVTLASQNKGLIEVRSVYDTDGLQRMGETVLSAADVPSGCSRRHRADRTGRSVGHASQGGEPGEDEGPGRPGLRLRAGPLRARYARGRAAIQHDGPAQRDRRDRVRASADPRLRAGRTRWFVQAASAGRHAAGVVDRRRQGPQPADPPELDPGAAGRTPHLRRLPQPTPRGVFELRRGGQRHAGRCVAHAVEPAQLRRDDGVDAHASVQRGQPDG